MPPRSKSKARAKALARVASKVPAPAIPVIDKKTLDLEFLSKVSPESPPEDIYRTFEFFGYGFGEGGRDYIKASASAVESICQDQAGFVRLLEAKGIEMMLSLVRYMGETKATPGVSEAVNGAAALIYQHAAKWLDEVDKIDFHELKNVLYLGQWLGAEDEDIALAVVGAMERFVLYRIENGATIVQSDGLEILHRIIGHNRAPELVTETFQLLFRLCDIPGDETVRAVWKEKSLVKTVVESLLHAPLNMRLQLAGIRLLALLSQLEASEYSDFCHAAKDIRALIVEVKAEEVVQQIVANLRRSGLTHAASWMETISSRIPTAAQLAEQQALEAEKANSRR